MKHTTQHTLILFKTCVKHSMSFNQTIKKLFNKFFYFTIKMRELRNFVAVYYDLQLHTASYKIRNIFT